MICPICLKKAEFSFLANYLNINSNVVMKFEEENSTNDVSEKQEEENKCLIENFSKESIDIKSPIFFKENWLENLCKCEKCEKLHKIANLKEIYKFSDENVILIIL